MTLQPEDSEDFGAAFEAEYLLEFGFKLNVSRRSSLSLASSRE